MQKKLPIYQIGIFNLIIYVLIFWNSPSLKSQDLGFAERLIIGSSLTYIPNSKVPQAFHHEFSWSKNIAVNVTKSVYFGIEHINVYTKGDEFIETENKEKYFLVGLFTQIDFLPLFVDFDDRKNPKSRLFSELSWYYGNYCTCGFNDSPYKIEDLNYLGWGFGIDHPLNNWLSLDVAFKSNLILTNVPQKYAYTQYIIGLNVDLNGKSK